MNIALIIKDIIKGINFINKDKFNIKGLAIIVRKYLYTPINIKRDAPLIPGTILPIAYKKPAMNIVNKLISLSILGKIFSIIKRMIPKVKEIIK